MEKNAIINTAGKSDRFTPFTYEKPNGLFTFREEVLIERQNEQLLEAGVNENIIELTELKHRHAMGQSILNAFYWISWGLFKGSVNEEDGFFFLTSYRHIVDNINDVISSYEVI